MEKRVLFRSAWLPWVLLAPQLVIISVFFFWPAGQALVQSFQMQDSFGMSTEWVGLDNFKALFEDPGYLASFKTTAFFSILVAVVGIGLSLILAIFADRIIKGAIVYKTALLRPTPWPLRWRACCGCSCSPPRWAWWRTCCASRALTGTTCSTPTTR